MGCYLSTPDNRVYVGEGAGKKFIYATASCQGWRKEQEDAELCIPFYDDNASLFVLCDGHGGAEVAKYTVEHFPDFIKNHPLYKEGDYEKALEEAFIDFDEHLKSDEVMEELNRIAHDEDDREKDDDQKSRQVIDLEGEGSSKQPEAGGSSSSAGTSSAGPSSSNGPRTVVEDVDTETLRREAHMPLLDLIGEHFKSEKVIEELSRRLEAKGDEQKGSRKIDLEGEGSNKQPEAGCSSGSAGIGNLDEEDDSDDSDYEGDADDEVEDDDVNGDDEDEEEDEEDDEDEDEEIEGEDEDDDDDEEGEDEDEDENEEVEGEEDLFSFGIQNFLKPGARTHVPGKDSGCTVVVALVKDNKIYVASAGDSRCILILRNGECKPMSFDHKPEDTIERQRITKAGGRILDGRVNGGLNLSRAFGDFCYKNRADLGPREQMITALPDVKTAQLNPEEVEYIFLACDGIWNSMKNKEVTKFIRTTAPTVNNNLIEICLQLFRRCMAPGTDGDGTGCDNMTCIIAKYTDPTLKQDPANSDLNTEEVKESDDSKASSSNKRSTNDDSSASSSKRKCLRL